MSNLTNADGANDIFRTERQGIQRRRTNERRGPAGWVLRGDAFFETTEGEKRQSFAIKVYRYQDEWYFVTDYDPDWDKVLLTKARLKADYADEILVRNETTSPLQISDLHAFIN